MTHDVSDDVTPAASETAAVDPQAPWRFSLRGHQSDQAIVQRVIDAHRLQGLNISYNAAILVCIRRSAIPDADTEEEARAQIEQHWSDCQLGCTPATIKCPEGWRLRDAWTRAINHRRHTTPQPSPATAAAWRRTFTRTESATA